MKALSKILLAVTAVAALSVAYPAKANLVTNGGFETGDFTGWTPSASGAAVTSDFFGFPPHSGSFQAHITNGSITQTLMTMAAQSYTISFWLEIPGGVVGDSFAVKWGGSTIFTQPFQALGYTEFTFTETASSASTALQFLGIGSDATNWLLDDVSVNAVGTVPDGGTTVSLLGCALFGLAALRRKLSC